MPDSAAQLQAIYMAGYELERFDRFPGAVGVVKDGCVALLEQTPGGLRIIGTPGWRMGEAMGVLIEKAGRKCFQLKDEVVEATPERLAALESFRRELEELLAARA